MNPLIVSQLRRELLAAAGLTGWGVRVEPIRVWRLSGVERLHTPRGVSAGIPSVIFKYAGLPFRSEAEALVHAARHRVPVPALLSSGTIGGILGMILTDLGPHARDATTADAAAAAVHVHSAPAAPWMPRLSEYALAALPREALDALGTLRTQGRYRGTDDLAAHLAAIARVADVRAKDAELRPFGLCHGELHPTAVHIGSGGRLHVLDFAMALHGPGLLDLAAWSGLRKPADPTATRALIAGYVAAGGHRDALAERGGLRAEEWALGWHRVQAAHWLISCAIAGIDAPDADDRHIDVLRRQLGGARVLLNA